MERPAHSVEIAGRWLPIGGCAIHFYYSAAERRRFGRFLLDGLAAGDAVILSCDLASYEAFRPELEGGSERGRGFSFVVGGPDYGTTIASIHDCVAYDLRRKRSARVLVDFTDMVREDEIFEAESELDNALCVFPVATLSQYDGRQFSAAVTIEQFRTHGLALVGNVLVNENAGYIPPRQYRRVRAAAS